MIEENLDKDIQNISNNEQEKLKQQNLPKKIPLTIVWTTSQILVAKLVKLMADKANDMKNEEKKQTVLNTVKTFYDTVFVFFDIPFVPSFIEPIIHNRVKQILIILVSATIDATVKTFQDTGVISS